MIVKFKKLNEKAVIPSYAKTGDAGLDLTAIEIDHFFKQPVYKTGLAVEIPSGYVGLVFPRSSIRKYQLVLSSSVGVIDESFRGEIMVSMRAILPFNSTDDETIKWTQYEVGDRVAQLIIMPYPTIEPVESDTLSDTIRGTGGFGSTGK